MIEITSIIPPSADRADQSAFASVEAALRFAFSQVDRGEPDSLAKHQPRRGGQSIFEDKVERAAWSGDIKRRIAHMPRERSAILVVRFAPRSFPCSCRRACCSGWSKNEAWHEAAAVLVDEVIVAGGAAHRSLRAGILKRWAIGEKLDIGVLADACGMHRNTAGKYNKVMRTWLDDTLRLALDDAYNALSS